MTSGVYFLLKTTVTKKKAQTTAQFWNQDVWYRACSNSQACDIFALLSFSVTPLVVLNCFHPIHNPSTANFSPTLLAALDVAWTPPTTPEAPDSYASVKLERHKAQKNQESRWNLIYSNPFAFRYSWDCYLIFQVHAVLLICLFTYPCVFWSFGTFYNIVYAFSNTKVLAPPLLTVTLEWTQCWVCIWRRLVSVCSSQYTASL